MENKRNIAAEIVCIQSELHDIESDIKKTQRSLKKVKKSIYCPASSGLHLDGPFDAREVLQGQLSDLKMRKAECELRLARLEKEKDERKIRNVW